MRIYKTKGSVSSTKTNDRDFTEAPINFPSSLKKTLQNCTCGGSVHSGTHRAWEPWHERRFS